MCFIPIILEKRTGMCTIRPKIGASGSDCRPPDSQDQIVSPETVGPQSMDYQTRNRFIRIRQ